MDNNSVLNPLANIERIHYLDQLRAYALLAGILMHASYTYGYIIQDIWYLTDQTCSKVITQGFLFLHLFRMPVFYLIAGFFANYIYQKRGVKGFLKHRLKRIGLPFIIFTPLVLIAFNLLIVLILFYLPVEKMSASLKPIAPAVKAQIESYFGKKSGSLNNVKDANTPNIPENKSLNPDKSAESNVASKVSAPNPDGIQKTNTADSSKVQQSGPQITQHLWFLYYLLLFCLCAALFQMFSHPFITGIFTKLFTSPVYLWLIPLFMIPSLYYIDIPWGAPMHIIPRLWPFGYFGIFFLLGWHFFYHQDYPDKFKKHFRVMIVFSIIASAYFIYFSPEYIISRSNEPAKETMASILFSQKMVLVILEAYLSLFLTIISLILGKRYLNFSNKYVRFISDSSYWIFIIHFPLVTYIQVFLVTAPFSGYLKLIISSAILFFIGLITYRYIVRYTFIGTMLNGKRIRGME
ncbi:MAG: acyltransferase family protein [Deltaproteobacteria bacterium]|nr:acyltransferase family protein [Deltaproteobacteria bacterium]